MVYRIPVQNGVGACGVVANHASERGAVAARGVWSRHQSAGRQRGVEAVQHQPGLYANLPRFLVYFQNAVKMLRKVDDQGFRHRLSGQGGPAAARQRRHAETSGFLDRRLHVVHRARNQHGARLHAVDAGVGRVQRPRHLVEKQLARNAGRKRMPKVLQGVVHAGLCRLTVRRVCLPRVLRRRCSGTSFESSWPSSFARLFRRARARRLRATGVRPV